MNNRYIKLSDYELDGLLVLAFYPNKKEKINISSKEIFENEIIKKLITDNLTSEFGENVIFFVSKEKLKKRTIEQGDLIYFGIMAEVRILKMAALKTYDENKEL